MANVHTFHMSNKTRQLIGLAAQGSLNSSWVSPFASSGVSGDADRAVFLFWLGTVSSGTVDVKLQQAQDAAGTGAKDITGAALTQMGTASDERIRTIEIGPGAMDDANNFKFVRVSVTVSTGTPIYGVAQILHRLRYPNAEQHSTYDEQVVVL